MNRSNTNTGSGSQEKPESPGGRKLSDDLRKTTTGQMYRVTESAWPGPVVPFRQAYQQPSASVRIPAYEAVFSCDSATSAISAIMVTKLPGESDSATLERFVSYLRTTFGNSLNRSDSPVWKELRSHPTFAAAAVSYLRKSVPTFFRNRNNRSMYEDIEFGLFLLGNREDFDTVEDIRDNGVRGISKLFAEHHAEIVKGLADMKEPAENVTDAVVKMRGLELVVERFEMLCEIVNKVAALHSVNRLDHGKALTLIMVIATQVEVIGEELEDVDYDRFTRNKLKFIEGKLLGNYSHLEKNGALTPEEAFRKLDSIVGAIEQGYRLQKESRFWDVPSRASIAETVREGNLALANLETAETVRALDPGNARAAELRKLWSGKLYGLYAKAVGATKEFGNAESVLEDFNSRPEVDEFAIETICHVAKYGNVSSKTLGKSVTKLITENPYSNAFHEEYKIKFFATALDKFGKSPNNERHPQIAYWIREYARENEKKTGLVSSYSHLYMALANFFASVGSESDKEAAMDCYLRATRIADKEWRLKYGKEEESFLKSVGGIEECRKFERVQFLEREAEIHHRFLGLIAQAVEGEAKPIVLRHVCEAVENLFYGICSADIVRAKEKKEGERRIDRSILRRGNRAAVIRCGEKFLILQYPGNLETVFQRIFDRHKDFIRTTVANILAIINRNHELSEANLYLADAYAELDRQTKTDEVTSLPNLRKYQEDLPSFAEAERVRSMLFRIENLSEINGAYGIGLGNEFVRSVIGNLLATLGSRNFDWKVYRVAPKEFLFVEIGDDARNREEEDFDLVAQELQSTVTAYPFYPDLAVAREETATCLHAQVAVSYSSDAKTEVYQKLHIAIQDAKNGPRVVRFDEERHSEDRLRLNLAGNSLVTEAIIEDRIIPYYQAIVDIRTGEVHKYECLARLKSRDGEILPPSAFIEHAKRAGVLPMLTRIMFQKACANLADSGTHFSINVSWQDLADPDLVKDMEDMMSTYGVDPSHVTIEILEEALLSNRQEFVGKIARLKEIGCKIALDDFGSEGSNFSRFEEEWWPDVIKIDGSFIRNIEKNPSKRRIARAIARAAEELGCEIVAEFVGTEGAREIVAEMGIRYGQGYHFHQPQAFDPKVGGLPERFDVIPMEESVRRKVSDTLAGKLGT